MIKKGLKYMSHILVIEDEVLLSDIISEFLTTAGYKVTQASDGRLGLKLFNQQTFNLVLLDIMLPYTNGFEVLKKIRAASDIPIIMLTALGDEHTQLSSFNLKIDDYIIKPVMPSLLVKRIEAVLRRTTTKQTQEYIGALQISYENCEIVYQGNIIPLTKKEFEILACLTKRPNYTIPRSQIIYQVWGYEDDLDTRLLDNHFKNIRKKLPEILIRTITGIGYKLEIIV